MSSGDLCLEEKTGGWGRGVSEREAENNERKDRKEDKTGRRKTGQDTEGMKGMVNNDDDGKYEEKEPSTSSELQCSL